MVDFTNNTFDGKTTINENPQGKIEEHLTFGEFSGEFKRTEVAVYNNVKKIVPKELSDELLSEFFDAFVRNSWDQAHKLIKPLVSPETFSSFDSKRKKSVGNTYLNFCWVRKLYAEAIEWYSGLTGEEQNITELRVWHTLIERDANGTDVDDALKGFFYLETSNPTVLAVLMESGIQELQESVVEILRAWLEDEAQTSDRQNYYAFNCLAEYDTEHKNFALARQTLDAVKQHVEDDTLSNLKYRLFYAQINLTEITSDPDVVECIHLPARFYAPLKALEGELHDIVQLGKEHDFHQINALDTYAVIKTLLYKPEEALEVYQELTVQELPVEMVTHMLGCYQEISDYEAIVQVIESLSEDKQAKLSNYHTLALISLGKWDRALEVCPVDAPERKLVDPDLKMDLEEIDDLFYSMQMAYHKYIATDDEELKSSYVEFLSGLNPEELRYRISRAYYLYLCEQTELAIELYEEIFTEVGAGYGRAFADFMYALQQKNYRKRSDYWFSQFSSEAPLDAFMPLKHHHLTFIQITKNIAAFKKEIEKTIGRIPDKYALPYRTRWVQSTFQHKNWKQQIQDKVKQWGLWPEGRLKDQLDYLRVVSHYLEPQEVLPEWYNQILQQSHEAELLEYYILYVLGRHGRQADDDWTNSCNVVQDKCAVELSDGKILVFDTEASKISRVSDVYSSDIRYAQDFIGKSVGDTVRGDVTIQAIYSPYLWAYKYAQEQLPKYKDTDLFHHITMPENGTTEEMVAPLKEMLKRKAEHIADVERTIFERKLPYLTVMGHFANPVQAWNTFLTKDTEQRFGFAYSMDRSLLRSVPTKNTAVVDITILAGLGILYSKPHLIEKLWPEVAVVSQTIQQIFYEKAETETIPPNTMTLNWDSAYDALGKSTYSSEVINNHISNCSAIIEAYEEKKIAAIDSVPAHEITGADKMLIEILDISSRDSLLACYGHDDRFFVTDDPNLAGIAQKIGITTLNSCQLMFMLYVNKVIELEEFSEWFIISSTGSLSAESVAGVVLDWLMKKEDYDQGMFDRMFDKLLPDPAITNSNMKFLVHILDGYADKAALTDAQRHVIEHLLGSMTSQGKDVVTLERILIEARHKEIRSTDAVISMILRHSGYSYTVVHSKTYTVQEIYEKAIDKGSRDLSSYLALKYHAVL